MTDCKHAFAKLAKCEWTDPRARTRTKAVLDKHGETVLEAWRAKLPRFSQARTPEGAWQYFVDLDRVWRGWVRRIRRDFSLEVVGSANDQEVTLTVSARDGVHSFLLASTEPSVRCMTPATRFFDRAWATLDVPSDDIIAANTLLAKPHDVAPSSEQLAFASSRPPRSAPREELISWLLWRTHKGAATKAELLELDQLGVALIANANVATVAPVRPDDEASWTRWLLAVDSAIGAINRDLPAAAIYVAFEIIEHELHVSFGLEMLSNGHSIGSIDSPGVVAALRNLFTRMGVTEARWRRAVSVLGPQLERRLGDRLQHLRYLDTGAFESAS